METLFSLVVSVLSLVTALITLYVAWRIPHQIMINQRYAELLTEYRSIEMGDAVLSIFDFFVNDCGKQTDQKVIDAKYVMRYNNEIKVPKKQYRKNKYKWECYDPHKTLHFKRRLVDHFFWLLADLRFNPKYPIKIPKQRLRKDFSRNEWRLLNIIQRMNTASEETRIDASSIDKADMIFSNKENSPMARYREKLFKEAKRWPGK
jgi:hypothetical protein